MNGLVISRSVLCFNCVCIHLLNNKQVLNKVPNANTQHIHTFQASNLKEQVSIVWLLQCSWMMNTNHRSRRKVVNWTKRKKAIKILTSNGKEVTVPFWLNPSTHRVHKTWTFLIITHNSWYRSRKIKEDSSTEREKFPLRFEPIFITVQCTSRSQDFSNEKWSRNLQIGNAFNDWNSTISHANWQKSFFFYFFFLL